MNTLLNGQNCTTNDPAPLPETVVPAMSYIPFQEWEEVYQVLDGYKTGTIFPCLDKPFLRGGGMQR